MKSNIFTLVLIALSLASVRSTRPTSVTIGYVTKNSSIVRNDLFRVLSMIQQPLTLHARTLIPKLRLSLHEYQGDISGV